MDFAPAQIELIVNRVLERLRNTRFPARGGQESNELRVTERVVTARLLHDRLTGIQKLVLEPNSLLTPAARDLLKDKGIQIDQSGTAAGNGIESTNGGSAAQVQIVNDNGCETQALMKSIQSAQRGGKIIVNTDRPHLLLCRLNRQESIRAAIVESSRCLPRAIKQLDPNVFVVDSTRTSLPQLNQVLTVLKSRSFTA